MDLASIESLFTYHAPGEHQVEKMKKIREEAKRLAVLVSELTPASAEQALAVRAIHLATMHANSAIALHDEKH